MLSLWFWLQRCLPSLVLSLSVLSFLCVLRACRRELLLGGWLVVCC